MRKTFIFNTKGLKGVNPGGGEGLEQLHDDACGAWGSTGAHRGGSGLVSGRSGGGRGALSLSRTAHSAHSRRVSSLSDSVGYSLSAQSTHGRGSGGTRGTVTARARRPRPRHAAPPIPPHTPRAHAPAVLTHQPPSSCRLVRFRPRRRTALAPSHVTNDTDRGVSGVHFSDPHPKALHDDETDTAYRPRLQKI